MRGNPPLWLWLLVGAMFIVNALAPDDPPYAALTLLGWVVVAVAALVRWGST